MIPIIIMAIDSIIANMTISSIAIPGSEVITNSLFIGKISNMVYGCKAFDGSFGNYQTMIDRL